MANVVIIDDDSTFQSLLLEHCGLLGHEASLAGSLEEGKKLLSNHQADLVFLDVRLPDGNGLELLPYIHELPSSPEVIIITGMGDANGAEMAIKNGAWDYLQKPLSRQEIILHVKRALEYHEKKIQRSSHVNLKRDEIVGKSKALRFCLDQVAQCAETDSGVLITGETGTGKELFARAIHLNSSRSKRPFIVVDCASLPENLVESILFGHVKGAFTGANSDRRGLVEQADGGTLFIDEVGELPIEIQKSFLRLLQERVYRPLGKDREHTSDFRLVAATNRDLEAMVRQGTFRSDLFFRLNTFNIHLPPLRERGTDLEKLTMNFVFSICRRNRLPIKGVAPETLEALEAYSWPGNIRELENTLDKAIISDPMAPVLYPIHLPPEIRLCGIRSKVSLKHEQFPEEPSHHLPAPTTYSLTLPFFKEYRRLQLSRIEKQYLQRLLAETEGDGELACRLSGLSRSRLYGLLKIHSLFMKEFSSPKK
ncbi:sigma-54-dependent transcriptional regulator [Desulfopila aestuarii]|uniref:Two-component system, NtrC family, response regulator n=1 Tax=Desulfopila aestuarii DSM 18488 TaxID=1121416 RepID=A0A1M7YIT6_9BACT|nr:sigma-54 dependent transcriptional regulator [Desulfopila aestuarii]SHO52428.1 two-component system, NtrC family, response regulator [Desulfopila aestuarii DSM 18488]